MEDENGNKIEETGGSEEMKSRLAVFGEDMTWDYYPSTSDDKGIVKANETNKEVVIETSGTGNPKPEGIIIDDIDNEKYLPTTLPDNGKRREFQTGSVRDSRAGKGRFDLISPIALKRLAKHYEAGALKYNPRNWEKGQPLMSYIDSAQRHLNEWVLNKLLGIEDVEDHLAAVMWNAAAFMHTKEMIECGHLPAELDDIPGPVISNP